MSSLEGGIDEVRMIGISGIGGGGKTTLARAVFDQISRDFEGISFVENIRDTSKKFGLQTLQKQVITDVSNEKNIILHSVGHGKNMIIKMLRGKKVLIVLDDVDHNDQLLALVGEPNWFKEGSRIIITTRNEQVLTPHGVMPIHKVDLLTNDEAKLLFNRCAFRADIPTHEYQELALEAACFAGDHPLYIKALGLFLYGKTKREWRDQLERLKEFPMNEPFKILELSYTSLDDDFKELFLDVACFLKGKRRDDAIRILESCWCNAITGLRDLELKSLITVSDDQHLDMHDRIQEMGRYIVRREYPHDPAKHSRLWEHEKIKEILDNELDNVETRGIALDDRGSDIFADGFGNIKRLIFLRMVSKNDENTHLISQNFPYTLRYLSWEFYPYWSLPRTFQAAHLVALELPDCRIKTLWDGDEKKALEKLRFLVLSHSKLTSLDLDLTPNLERLDLEECQHLVHIHMVNASLQKLVFLNLTGCSSIRSLVFIKKLESLEVLHLSCLSLERFPDIIPGPDNNSLLELHFRVNNIEELPASIGNLKNLVYLDLHFCRKVRSLPGSICGLQELKDLDLCGCTLKELPDDIGSLECLEMLNLSCADIKQLPDDICRLKRLITLDLSYCSYLEKLPEDIGQLECLEKLILTGCEKIREIPGSFCRLKNLKFFCLLKCIQLQSLPDGLELIESLEELYVKGTRIKIPESILSLQGLKIDETSPLKASSTIKKQKYHHE